MSLANSPWERLENEVKIELNRRACKTLRNFSDFAMKRAADLQHGRVLVN
jgi:hypothetical protein